MKRLRVVSGSTCYYVAVKIRQILCCGKKSSSGGSMIVDRAKAKLERQLDVVRIVKTMRRVDLLSRIIMS